MIASLYQSGSSAAGTACGSVRSGRERGSSGISVAWSSGGGGGARASSALGARPRNDAPHGGGMSRGIEADAVVRAAPRLALAGEQLLGHELFVRTQSEVAERELEHCLVRLVRVEIDCDHHDVALVRRHLTVEQHVVVVR